jgi:hypothetical protein
MDFVNHTPFPALAFAGIDPHNQHFHVMVLRQTLAWDEHMDLGYADRQQPLCEADQFLGATNQSVVRQESDLCHYKPRCDVIVNAVAHAPRGRPAQRFAVRLVLKRQRLDAALIDKTLAVIGPRRFTHTGDPAGQRGATTRKAWRLSEPEPIQRLALHNQFAFGGECRIDQGEPAAQQLARRYWLTPEQLDGHPDAQRPPAEQPAAHCVFESNPLGLGFVQNWYVEATRLADFPAPQIEHPDLPISAEWFADCANGGLSETQAASLVAGFGVRPKAHPERRKLVGTVDAAFINGEAWLPADFDFAIWNAAQPDQQTEFLEGGEVLELTNLCAPDAPGAAIDAQGDTLLRLELPAQQCFVLARLHSGGMFTHPMVIDTVIIEPENRRLSLVWRSVLGKDQELPIRKLEARMRSFAERDAERAEIERIKEQLSKATEHPDASTPTSPPSPKQANPDDLSDDEFAAWVRDVLKDG